MPNWLWSSWCCLWLALLLSCVSLNGCSWLGRINSMRFVFAYHQLKTVFSSGVTSACTCLMNEKSRVVWWSSRIAVTILPFFMIVYNFRLKGKESLCLGRLTSLLSPRRGWYLDTAPLIYICLQLAFAESIICDDTGIKILGWVMHGIPTFIYTRRCLGCIVGCSPVLASKILKYWRSILTERHRNSNSYRISKKCFPKTKQ